MYSVSVLPVVEDHRLDAAREAGVVWLEIKAADFPGQDRESQKRYMVGACEKIMARDLNVASYHIAYWPAGLGTLDNDERKMQRDHIVNTLELGREFFPEAIYILHPGELLEKPELADHQRNLSKRTILEIAEVAGGLGVQVAVENMRKGDPNEKLFPRIGQEMAWIRDVVENSESLVICLDTGHAHISGDICEMARIAGDKLKVIHLSDNFGVFDNHHFPISQQELAERIADRIIINAVLDHKDIGLFLNGFR